MSFLSMWWALAGLLSVPVILLYLLKMRRQPITVSSTLLWEQVLADMRANAPFQKLRRNLLLILQLLTLALLVASLMQPVVRAVGGQAAEMVVIIDASASMQATDAPGGGTRFEHAIAEAGKLVDNLRRNDRMMLIIVGPAGQGGRTAFTSSKTELHRVLDEARCYDCPAQVGDALRLAASSLADKSGQTLRGKVYLLSDGGSVQLPDSPALLKGLEYVRIGKTDQNVGITSLGVQVSQGRRQQVLVGVSNYGGDHADVMVHFYYGSSDAYLDSVRLSIEGRSQASAVLDRPLDAGRMWVRLECSPDALPLDNEGYVLLAEPRRPLVRLVSAGSPTLAKFLQAGPEAGLFEAAFTSPADYTGDEPADVTIFDCVSPPKLPAGDVVLIRPPSPVAGFTPAGEIAWPEIANARTEDDLFRHGVLTDLGVARAERYTHDGSAEELVVCEQGPLIACATDGVNRRYLLAFKLPDSTWATQGGLLLFMGNVLERAREAYYVGQAQLLAAGMPARLPAGDADAEVLDPHGDRQTVPGGVDSFAATAWTGFYQVERDDISAEFCANLLSAGESDITPKSLVTQSGRQVAEQIDVVRSNRPIWPILVIVAIALLTIEWYCYHRRLG